MFLKAVLAVKPFLADGALEAVGCCVEAFVTSAGARLGEPLATIAARVCQLVTASDAHHSPILSNATPGL